MEKYLSAIFKYRYSIWKRFSKPVGRLNLEASSPEGEVPIDASDFASPGDSLLVGHDFPHSEDIYEAIEQLSSEEELESDSSLFIKDKVKKAGKAKAKGKQVDEGEQDTESSDKKSSISRKICSFILFNVEFTIGKQRSVCRNPCTGKRQNYQRIEKSSSWESDRVTNCGPTTSFICNEKTWKA
ncbi:hypothetical protein BJV82DRAFT_685775 [Fennellomyces sp. T-0311]|nr:hypothetical protein BJV82DRAFT_685775 [Fennellomyces sp. T-0311]